MRFHHDYPLLQIWLPSSGARTVMRPDLLQIARLEPTVAGGVVGDAVLDLTFSDGNATAVLPYVRVECNFLIERERTPLIWPEAARVLGTETLDDLEMQLIPWLESLTLGRQTNDEVIRAFSNTPALGLFEKARAAGFLGAAAYAQAMAAFARYVYAARFCTQRNVGIDDSNGANGAAMLALRAPSVRADLGSAERNDLARRWFGIDVFGTRDDASGVTISDSAITVEGSGPRVHTVPIASPVPTDVMVSFDLEDSPPASSFGVRADIEAPMRSAGNVALPATLGGSSGRILMLMREDFVRAADADVDEARALADRLRAEGFAVELTVPSAVTQQSSADLVHVFGLTPQAALVQALSMFRERGVPIVASAQFTSDPREAEWGPGVLRAVFQRERDEARLAEYFDLLQLRKVSAAAVDGDSSVAAVMQLIDETVQGQPPVEASPVEPAGIMPLVGDAPFVFVHAPVEWRTNLPLLVRVTAPRNIPVVVAGPGIDIDALRAAQRYAPELLIHLPSPTDAEVEALYRTARVYADVSWASRGQARIARAAACGCSLLLSNAVAAPDLWPTAARADAASLSALGAALERAWNFVPGPVRLDPGAAFSAAIFAYAKAQQRGLPA